MFQPSTIHIIIEELFLLSYLFLEQHSLNSQHDTVKMNVFEL